MKEKHLKYNHCIYLGRIKGQVDPAKIQTCGFSESWYLALGNQNTHIPKLRATFT